MIRICMAGACGRMGRRIIELAAADGGFEIAAALDAPAQSGTVLPYGTSQIVAESDPAAAAAKADVLIDFTVAEACLGNVRAAVAQGKPAVVGTTGLDASQRAELVDLANQVPIVHAPNMSVGVNLLFKLTEQVARTLGLDYNVEIVEIHHNQKKDSPSGTAARLAECAAQGLALDAETDVVHGRHGLVGARPVREVGMHALRGGDVAGEHTVVFAGPGERIELTHRAHNRDNFARGALIAARDIVNRSPGLYDMQDILGLR